MEKLTEEKQNHLDMVTGQGKYEQNQPYTGLRVFDMMPIDGISDAASLKLLENYKKRGYKRPDWEKTVRD